MLVDVQERPAGESKAPSAAQVWAMAVRAVIDTVVGWGAGVQVVCGLQHARLDPGGLHQQAQTTSTTLHLL